MLRRAVGRLNPCARGMLGALAFAAGGCSSIAPVLDPSPPAPVEAPPPPEPQPAVRLACADAPEALVAPPPRGLPPLDATSRGDVLRCARGAHLAAADVDHQITLRNAKPPGAVTGVTLYRIVYRVRRGEGASEPASLAGAVVFVPDGPRVTDAAVVFAHDEVGLAAACAPSHGPPAAIPLAFAGAGLITIAPDGAGFGFGAAPHAFYAASDEARSLFDAARALAKLVAPDLAPKRLVFVGDGAGGHAVLAAQALARADGLEPAVAGVVATSPMWVSPRLFAAVARDDAAARKDAAARDLLFSLLYFHGHGELDGGAGAGVAILNRERRGEIAALLDTHCLAQLDDDLRDARPEEVIDRGFAEAVATCLAHRPACSS
ncbi:MAG TPA: hypothetical protein VHB21_19245, partial [Minicystis sp.]|nr:hypothetical protein [Minicystis sp.]